MLRSKTFTAAEIASLGHYGIMNTLESLGFLIYRSEAGGYPDLQSPYEIHELGGGDREYEQEDGISV